MVGPVNKKSERKLTWCSVRKKDILQGRKELVKGAKRHFRGRPFQLLLRRLRIFISSCAKSFYYCPFKNSLPMSHSRSFSVFPGWIALFRTALVGFFMGLANLVPGVSGGTIALVCGIYEKLVFALKSFNRAFVEKLIRGDLPALLRHTPWLFLAALGGGVVVAFFSMARVLAWLIENHQIYLWAFFTGLILSSLVYLLRLIEPWDRTRALLLVGSLALALLLTGPFSLQMPTSAPFLFLAGMIAVCALILPGLSGSHILVVIGLYGFILETFNNLHFVNLMIFGLGMVVGILSFAQVIGWLLEHARSATLAILSGLMAGSLPAVWPWQEPVTFRLNSAGEQVPLQQAPFWPTEWPGGTEGPLLLLCLIGGILAVLLLTQLSEKKKLS